MDIKINELKEKIDLSIINSEVLHIKNFFNFNHSWDLHINILNYQYNFSNIDMITTSQIEHSYKVYTAIVKHSPNFHFHIWELGKSNLLGKIENHYLDINKFIRFFIPLLKNKESFTVKSSLNFVGGTPNEFIGMPHFDLLDVLSFQSVGSVKYNIYKPINGKIYSPEISIDIEDLEKTTHLLEQNDLFFMPKGTIHQVEVIEPRVTLIMDIKR